MPLLRSSLKDVYRGSQLKSIFLFNGFGASLRSRRKGYS